MISKYSDKNIERFWRKVDKDRSTIFYNGTRCWEWVGGYVTDGYGAISLGNKKRAAHRVSYELAFGEIPVDKPFILHHCDNPPCVNPDHLFSGTNQDNMDDKVNKGRQAKGVTNGKHKLTDEQVSEIRRRYGFRGVGGETSIALAKEFGVSQVHIFHIVNFHLRK